MTTILAFFLGYSIILESKFIYLPENMTHLIARRNIIDKYYPEYVFNYCINYSARNHQL